MEKVGLMLAPFSRNVVKSIVSPLFWIYFAYTNITKLGSNIYCNKNCWTFTEIINTDTNLGLTIINIIYDNLDTFTVNQVQTSFTHFIHFKLQSEKIKWLPPCVFAAMSLLTVILFAFIPETYGVELPQRMKELTDWYHVNKFELTIGKNKLADKTEEDEETRL